MWLTEKKKGLDLWSEMGNKHLPSQSLVFCWLPHLLHWWRLQLLEGIADFVLGGACISDLSYHLWVCLPSFHRRSLQLSVCIDIFLHPNHPFKMTWVKLCGWFVRLPLEADLKGWTWIIIFPAFIQILLRNKNPTADVTFSHNITLIDYFRRQDFSNLR